MSDSGEEAKEALARRRALRRAAKARYRAKHPDKVAAIQKRYRQKYRAKIAEAKKRYYETHREQRRAYDRQRDHSEHRRAFRAQYRAKNRERNLARRRERYHWNKEKWRTAEKVKALGPLQLTVTLNDFVKDFCDSLETDSLPSETSSTPGSVLWNHVASLWKKTL